MNPQMEIMDSLDAKRREALAQENWHAAMVYSTAEDLTDAMLKGKHFPDASAPLLESFTHNKTYYANEAEAEAWDEAITILTAVRSRFA